MDQPEPSFTPNRSPFSQVFSLGTLTQGQRADLVALTTGDPSAGAAPLVANLFQLSALGANMDLSGAWYAPSLANVASYHEIGSLGRAEHGHIVTRGYLFPFGHQAVVSQVFQRVGFGDGEFGNAGAAQGFEVRAAAQRFP